MRKVISMLQDGGVFKSNRKTKSNRFINNSVLNAINGSILGGYFPLVRLIGLDQTKLILI